MSTPAGKSKPWYLRWWVILIGVVLLVSIISAIVNPPADDDATTTPAPSPTPAVSDDERTAAFDSGLKTALGVQDSYSELAADPSLWGGYVSGVRVDGANAYVTLQVASGDAERDDLGERAARALSTLLPATAVEGINWLIVEDASGTVIDQQQPNPLS